MGKITVKSLCHCYSPKTAFEKKALDDINFSVAKGEFVGLIGHTGSGKSTLMQHLNALLTPTSGEVWVDGENIHADKKRLKYVRQQVGLVFQYPEHQLFEMTVQKDVAFGPENMGLSKAEVDGRVQNALESVGIGPKLFGKSPFELSGGERRRVAIAGVLAMNPEVLILDEPTAGLDPKGRDEILGQIGYLHKQRGITVMLVSHSMEDVARLASRIMVMSQGRLVYDGTPAQVFCHANELEQLGLAAPQVYYLMRGLSEQGLPVNADIFTVEEAKTALAALLCGGKAL